MTDLIRKDFALETIDEVRKNSHSFDSIDDALLHVRKAVSRVPSSGKWWIPCAKRLPNYYEDVFVSLKYDEVLIATRISELKGNNDGVWELADGDILKMNEVIAWMPLPKPYKG